MVRRFAVAVVVVLALGPVAAHAAAQTPVRPKQRFLGVVNGSPTRAVIRMACFGPITPWQLGHPMAGQSLGVTNRPLPVASTLAVGFTGAANAIAAYARFDSPLASPVVPRLGVFLFYDERQKLSTDVLLPCEGQGRFVFDPIDGGPTARPASVAVEFLGQP
jgi:hypothetical protein